MILGNKMPAVMSVKKTETSCWLFDTTREEMSVLCYKVKIKKCRGRKGCGGLRVFLFYSTSPPFILLLPRPPHTHFSLTYGMVKYTKLFALISLYILPYRNST